MKLVSNVFTVFIRTFIRTVAAGNDAAFKPWLLWWLHSWGDHTAAPLALKQPPQQPGLSSCHQCRAALVRMNVLMQTSKDLLNKFHWAPLKFSYILSIHKVLVSLVCMVNPYRPIPWEWRWTLAPLHHDESVIYHGLLWAGDNYAHPSLDSV